MQDVAFRQLSASDDRALVSEFYLRAADYIRLETGAEPTPAATEAFFTGSLPGHDCAQDLREGMFRAGRLEGIAELAFDLPLPGRATLTLMVLSEASRGQGLGTLWLARLAAAARAAGCSQLWLSVLESNPGAQRFWQRHGFELIPSQSYRPPRRDGESAGLSAPCPSAPRPLPRLQMMRSLL